ncbi:MAG: late competence development ComFB family protein [Spirochaetales bacterium]|nr:late competence development ComFB family protein [Spirochaetales bacterium]
MSLREEYDFEYLVNESENLVFEELDAQLEMKERANVCRCQDCILDMAALALNSMKPQYRVSLLGSVYASSLHISSAREEAEKSVKMAIDKISSNPSHN